MLADRRRPVNTTRFVCLHEHEPQDSFVDHDRVADDADDAASMLSPRGRPPV